MYCLTHIARRRRQATINDDPGAERLDNLVFTDDGQAFQYETTPTVHLCIGATAANRRKFMNELHKAPSFSMHPIQPHFEPDPLYAVFLDSRTPEHDRVAAQQRMLQRFFTIPPSLYDGVHEDLNVVSSLITDDGPMGESSSSPASSDNADEAQSWQQTQTDDRIQQLYADLHAAHQTNAADVPPSITADSQRLLCPELLPELRHYQRDAVNWMLDRERRAQFLPTEFVRMTPKWPDASEDIGDLFCNWRTGCVRSAADIGEIRIPSGGILADEMGLGKTVEMLALIVANRRPIKECSSECVPEQTQTSAQRRKKNKSIWCVCGKTEQPTRRRAKATLIACTRCGLNQHIRCVQKHATPATIADLAYKCPECWQTEMRNAAPVQSSATIIVTPPAIKQQWLQEVHKHIDTTASSSGSAFRVLVYDGVKQGGWISPVELARYDLIICDYNVLKTELHFMDGNRRAEPDASGSRGRGRRSGIVGQRRPFMPLRSPLPLVRWWRVCLDEAQMVESTVGQAARMVKRLPAVHRWSISGTPIEKSIDNLYGLVYFLGVQPYADARMWHHLTAGFEAADDARAVAAGAALVRLLQRFMWRTSKAQVWHSVGIPPQTERTHRVPMDDLLAFFYESQHRRCALSFEQAVAKLIGGSQGGGGDGGGATTKLARINTSTLRRLLEPLRQLRQDCTVPSWKSDGGGGGGGSGGGRVVPLVAGAIAAGPTRNLVSPDELHECLIAWHEMLCSNNLRNLAASLNHVAGMRVIRHEYEEAVGLYERVLGYAKEYTGNISVDTLQQVNALHNLLDTYDLIEKRTTHEGTTSQIPQRNEVTIDDTTKSEYRRQLLTKQSSYVRPQSAELRKCHAQMVAAAGIVERSLVEMPARAHRWWTELMNQHMSDNEFAGLLDRLSSALDLDQLRQIGASRVRRFDPSPAGLQLMLVQWLDKRKQERRQIRDMAAEMEKVGRNMQRRFEMLPDEAAQFDRFMRDTTDCHLRPDEESLELRLCPLCRFDGLLSHYRCLLFNQKVVRDDSRFGGVIQLTGNDNAPMQEIILQMTMDTLAHRSEPEVRVLLDYGKKYLHVLQAFKTEYRECVQYWVAFRTACDRIDELSQCKYRVHSDSDVAALQSDSLYSRLYINPKTIDMPSQLADIAEKTRLFEREHGTLKYLKRLQRDRKQDGSAFDEVCPICHQMPKCRYPVLLCGHHLCMECLLRMESINNEPNRNTVRCAVCRYKQYCDDIFYLQPQPIDSNPSIRVIGEFSPKVTAIVRTVLELRSAEPDVKVLIFSHWDTILTVVGEALQRNEVRVCCRSTPFHRSIDAFRAADGGVTALLLPLACGSKGLNLVEATHVFLVEPILNPAEELQAIGRVHRIGQTRPTTVHRFIVSKTIEETIYSTISSDKSGGWRSKEVTVQHLSQLFREIN